MIKSPKILMYAPVDVGLHNACTLHVLGVAKGFAENGFDVNLILPNPSSTINFDAFQHPDITFHYHYAPKRIPNTFKIFWAFPTLIKNLLKKPVFFYIRMHHLTWILLILAKMFKIHTCSEHNNWVKDEMKAMNRNFLSVFIGKAFQKLDAKLATKVRVVTPGITRFFKKSKHFFTAENGTDTSYFKPQNREDCLKELQLNPDLFYLGFVGTFVSWQGLYFALSALAPLLKTHKNIRLIFAGSGPEERKLKERCFELGLDDSVIFMGHVYLKDVVKTINCFDIALAPFTRGRNENISLSALKIRDYAACGRTIITSNIKDNENIGDFGVLFEPDNEQDFLAKMNFLIENTAVRKALSKKARQYAEGHFSWHHVSATIISKMGFHI